MIRNALALIGFFVLAVTFTPIDRWIASALEDTWGNESAEVLVVLGGSMLVPGTGPHAALGDDSYLRCIYAAWIARERHYRHIVVSGGGGLAEAMAHYLECNGVPGGIILEENAAGSTEQNALYTKRILASLYAPLSPPRVVVLTSDYHSRRARLAFEHAGLIAASIPVPDIIKRSSFVTYRWSGYYRLMEELGKLAYYKLSGKI